MITRKLQRLTFLVCLFTALQGQAQLTEIEPGNNNTPQAEPQPEKQRKEWVERMVFGGFMAAGFGSFTSIDVSPLVGYQVTDKFTPGIGITYRYVRLKDPVYVDYKINTFGGRIFAQYDLFYGFFAHTEYEHLWLNLEYLELPLTTYQDDVPGLFLGGGYRFGAGNVGGVQVMLLWNVLWEIDNPIYLNPYTLRFSLLF